ncbi:MAG: presenilin family intramembrane aspartyl protease [Candidatus Azambacteria bacterium]|nr:presenilin family intramembrane aspartyl protease [Candidatus Azambacteria bacterium]
MLSQNLNLKIFIQESIAFLLVGIISIFLAGRFYDLKAVTEASTQVVEWWQFLLAFGIGTAIVLGLIRISHGGLFLRIFFLFALFAGVLTTFGALTSQTLAFILSLILIFSYVLWPYIWLHDLVLILTLSGIAALIGVSLNPWTVALLLVVMSVYDYVAVYKTKHMVKMAKAMIAGRAIFAMIFPEKVEDFTEHIDRAHPGEGFMLLGTGDFVFPLIMASSAFTLSPLAPWLILTFSLLGLLIMHLIFFYQKIRRPMPALPPLAVCSIIGFIVAVLIK